MKNKNRIIYYICIVLGLLVLSYCIVPQVLSGKIVNQSDISGWQGMSHEMMEWNEAHPDNQTAWTQSMFGGMPTTTIHSSTEGDWTQSLYDFLLIGKRPATYLFISLLGSWLLMLAFGIHPLVAVGGAIAVTFCSYNLQIIQVGHNTKMQAIAFLPWVMAALVFTYNRALGDRKKYLRTTLLGSALFALALSFQIKANHPQISYYLAIIILVYCLALLTNLLINKEKRNKIKRFFVASALLLVLGIGGIATNAIKLLPTLEYTPYSMRGGSSENADGSKDSKGLDIDYATAWSYGWEELPNMLIPNFNGGSSAEKAPANSETVALLRQAGQSNLKEVSENLPMYWGPQPFTAGPMYMGAITIFLFVLALCIYRGRDRWWIIICTILAVFLALGSHFMAFTRFFYDYIPLYNKFRTVSMALVVLQFTLPLLAFLSLDRIIKDDSLAEKFRSNGWIALAVTGGFCLLCWIFPAIAGDFVSASDMNQHELIREAFEADRRIMLRTDALRSLIFILLAYGALYFGTSVPKYAPKSFATQPEMRTGRRRTGALIVCVLILIDLVSVNTRYLNSDDFVSEKKFKSQFALRPVDEMILEDKDPSYRVLDLSVNVFNDSHPSYWHKNIGGYSPAKLQRYQEYIDSHLNAEINSLYDILNNAETISEAEASLPYLEGLAKLNCRYIIIDGDYPPLKYRHAKGVAWFENPVEGDSVEMSLYEPNRMIYEYESLKGGKLIFSEVYYPKGWSLVVEDTGEVLEMELTDELFRCAEVPAGEHRLVMSFAPASYKNGENISRASSIAIILIVLISLALSIVPCIKKDEKMA